MLHRQGQLPQCHRLSDLVTTHTPHTLYRWFFLYHLQVAGPAELQNAGWASSSRRAAWDHPLTQIGLEVKADVMTRSQAPSDTTGNRQREEQLGSFESTALPRVRHLAPMQRKPSAHVIPPRTGTG